MSRAGTALLAALACAALSAHAGIGTGERCGAMRITIEIDGGLLPSMAGPRTIDADGLAPADHDAVCVAIEAARFFDRPAPRTPTPGGDRRTYIVTVIAEPRARTLTLTDPIGDASLSRLVTLLRDLTKAR